MSRQATCYSLSTSERTLLLTSTNMTAFSAARLTTLIASLVVSLGSGATYVSGKNLG